MNYQSPVIGRIVLLGAVAASAAIISTVDNMFVFDVIGSMMPPNATTDMQVRALVASSTQYGHAIAPVLGAVVLGFLGDRVGRKPALTVSLLLAGLALLSLALTPSFERIGSVATLAFFSFRCVLGFAEGGCSALATVYFFELAPIEHRGLYVGLKIAAGGIGVLPLVMFRYAASDVSLGHVSMPWRTAFEAIAVLLFFIGLLAYRQLKETSLGASWAREFPLYRDSARISLIGIAIFGGLAMLASMQAYLTLPTTLYLYGHIGTVSLIAVSAGLTAVLLAPLSGWLSDRSGRRPLMIVPGISLLVVFAWVVTIGQEFSGAATIAGFTTLVALLTLYRTVASVSLIESLPTQIRCSIFGIMQTASVAAVFLIMGQGGRSIIRIEIALHAIICIGGILAVLALPETAPIKTGQS